MGGTASKPARKLTNSVVENAGKAINRSQKVNQLPSQALKEKYERHIEQELLQGQNQNESRSQSQDKPQSIDESLNQGPSINLSNTNSTTTFDPKLLKKKLASKQVTKHSSEANVPYGKDGGDPQIDGTDPYDPGFVSSITRLGKQIHSISLDQDARMRQQSMALKQLKFRKQLFEEGEREVQSQMKQGVEAGHGSTEKEVIRTMVHARTLGAIINDIHDPRLDDSRILLDYQLHPDFLKELGKRFKVATNTVVIEDNTKEDEIGHRITPISSPEAMTDENGELGEAMGTEKLKTLKDRLSLDN